MADGIAGRLLVDGRWRTRWRAHRVQLITVVLVSVRISFPSPAKFDAGVFCTQTPARSLGIPALLLPFLSSFVFFLFFIIFYIFFLSLLSLSD